MDIETAATSEIKSRIASTELLSQFINEGDKEPKWDGFIYAYSNKSKSNDNGKLVSILPYHHKHQFNRWLLFCIYVTFLFSHFCR